MSSRMSAMQTMTLSPSTLSYEETLFMSADQAASAEGGFQALIPHLKTAALIVTILGAIPTGITAYNAYRFGVPFSQVSQRLAQYDLWVKNIDCKVDYKAISTAQGTRVDAGACAATGDIALKISTSDGKSTYQWIAYNELQKPGEQPHATGLLDLLIGAARAETPAAPVRVAQGAMEVMCQTLQSPKSLVRIVKEGGKCFKETVNPIRGTTDSRQEVPCETQCPAKG